MLRVQNLTVAYGSIKAVKDLSLELEPGSFAALLGRNGAGKTSLLKAIAGLVPPQRGRIFFDGQEITSLPPWERVRLGLSLVPEGRRIFAPLSVYENLKLGAFATNHHGKKTKESLDYVLDLFPALKERLYLPAGALSGGEQQMLAVARALMSQPKLLLLDEPSMGLAPKVAAKIFDSLSKVKGYLTVLLVEQNISRGLKLADKLFVLDSGCLVRQGLTHEISLEAIEEAYLGRL